MIHNSIQKMKIKLIERSQTKKGWSYGRRFSPKFARIKFRPSIRVNTIQPNCLFATAKCQKSTFKLLVDTGSVASLLSKIIFDKLGFAQCKLQRVKTTLTAADGSNIEIHGKIKIKFSMAGKIFEHEFIVADLHEMSGIMGMDFFWKRMMPKYLLLNLK